MKAITAAFGIDAEPLIGVAQNEKFGDYQSNAAMGLAKTLSEKTGQKTNPRQVAEQILAKLDLAGMAEGTSLSRYHAEPYTRQSGNSSFRAAVRFSTAPRFYYGCKYFGSVENRRYPLGLQPRLEKICATPESRSGSTFCSTVVPGPSARRPLHSRYSYFLQHRLRDT